MKNRKSFNDSSVISLPFLSLLPIKLSEGGIHLLILIISEPFVVKMGRRWKLSVSLFDSQRWCKLKSISRAFSCSAWKSNSKCTSQYLHVLMRVWRVLMNLAHRNTFKLTWFLFFPIFYYFFSSNPLSCVSLMCDDSKTTPGYSLTTYKHIHSFYHWPHFTIM